MSISLFFKLLSVVAIFSLMGCTQRPDEASSGQVLYEYHCAKCHKSSGNGKYLMGIPANRETYLSQSSVIVMIKDGHRSKPNMPPIPNISYSEAQKITQHLWTLKYSEK